MDNVFKPLEHNDDDVLSLANNELLKISQFREELANQLNSLAYNWSLRPASHNMTYKDNNLDKSRIRIKGLGIQSYLGDITIKWILPTPEGQDCEILRLGSTKWQKGKLRVQASVEMFPNEKDQTKKYTTHFIIEFSPNTSEITTPESPLDDLRQMINQETQS
ncbi:MAG TPA: hypothetical protein DEG17_17745 [Cyanobacteria bacterium UBA11149]|nr:hypothetical protein [Cyanobacteria bacterium UBA11367]HBE61110.1 hypothetical protein [Cyanobacteria bacterium UBA11366]HBK64380.1 hypothetical protein [Cyanobacteria bacterium UBA11166]HBR72714.1 hypothetical protein [Cyanobacteria bacterium UBA11159]HBS70716.1 hypothetical protein [Cyanobacteria bacterium UBA11153]HBW90665.1 hypothetical protein [Cyanobacteria bacterium UBA11149]HCA96131.1 hypothetical protein [Cyanobacteria bacterium UBA9226]